MATGPSHPHRRKRSVGVDQPKRQPPPHRSSTRPPAKPAVHFESVDDSPEPAVESTRPETQIPSIESRSATAPTRKGGPARFFVKHPGITTGIVCGLIALLLAVAFFWPDSQPVADNPPEEQIERLNEGDVPLPKQQTALCKIYTREPGFVVLVDGEPIRDPQGEMVTTPCEAFIPKGNHTITVAKEGYRDQTEIVETKNDREIRFDPQVDAFGSFQGILQSPLFQVQVGVPVALETLNSPGGEHDPYITRDGLKIYFYGERTEGRAIYTASRSTVWDTFDAPQIIDLSRGYHQLATPSINEAGTVLMYAVPDQARVMALTKGHVLDRFDDKTAVRFSKAVDAKWHAAQVLHDGHIYWSESTGGKFEAFTSAWKPREEEIPFSTLSELKDPMRSTIDALVASLRPPAPGLAETEEPEGVAPVENELVILSPKEREAINRQTLRRYQGKGTDYGYEMAEDTFQVIDPRTGREVEVWSKVAVKPNTGDVVKRATRITDVATGRQIATDIHRLTDFKITEVLQGAYRETEPARFPMLMHPCLSSDGLRQYLFDGQTLFRARREKATDVFSQLEQIATFPLPNYVPDGNRRQFFVTDDEQWMFYTDNPAAGGDLFVVRISPRRGWGYITRGRSIEQIPFPDDTYTPPTEEPNPGDEFFDPSDINPRLQPLAYQKYRNQFQKLMSERRYEEAEKLARNSQADEAFQKSGQLLQWDLQDAQRVRQFWGLVRKGATSLKPGEKFRVGTVDVFFQDFADDALLGETDRKTAVSKSIHNMTRVDVTALADRVVAEDDTEGHMSVATFLFYDQDSSQRILTARFKKTVDLANQFSEQLAQRQLHLARQEIARKNYIPGLKLLNNLRQETPDSQAAVEADNVESEIYTVTQWQSEGPRRWETTFDGSYTADLVNRPNSWLKSPEMIEDFELMMEFRGRGNGASGGVFFCYTGKFGDRPYTPDASYKIQLANDYGIQADRQSTGALLNIKAPSENRVRREGQWNTFHLKVVKGKAEVAINGKNVLNFDLDNTEIDRKGFVLLDGIVGGMSYRKIVLMDIPSRF